MRFWFPFTPEVLKQAEANMAKRKKQEPAEKIAAAPPEQEKAHAEDPDAPPAAAVKVCRVCGHEGVVGLACVVDGNLVE